MPQRQSDRWVTPSTVIVGILTVGAVLALAIAAITWLTVQGVDPDPMLKLVAQIGGGVAGVLSLLLQFANRASTVKTERNTGVLMNHTGDIADAVYEVAGAIPRPVGRHLADDTVMQMSAAPAPSGR